MNQDKIVVVMGGTSTEAEVSRRTGTAILNALKSKGYNAEGMELVPETFANDIQKSGCAIVFNALHGKFGEDGLLLFLNMCDDEDGRDYWFNGCEKGAEWFDQYFFDLIQNRSDFINYLKRGDYYKAFDEMLDYVNIFLEEATTGEQPYNFDHPYTEVK